MNRHKCNGKCKKCNCSRKYKYKLDENSGGRPSVGQERINLMKKGFTQIQSFATSLLSRGIKNKKIDESTKRLRVLSCFGDASIGGKIKPCQALQKSGVREGRFFCGGCGCGDKQRTWLVSDSEEYSKLDYPKLTCPLKMPGFSNYEKSANKETSRKFQIENYDIHKLSGISVTTPNPPEKGKENQ